MALLLIIAALGTPALLIKDNHKIDRAFKAIKVAIIALIITFSVNQLFLAIEKEKHTPSIQRDGIANPL